MVSNTDSLGIILKLGIPVSWQHYTRSFCYYIIFHRKLCHCVFYMADKKIVACVNLSEDRLLALTDF